VANGVIFWKMKRAQWKQLVDRLPNGMSQVAAARYLGMKETTVRYWLLKLGYRFADGRKFCWPSKRRLALTKFVSNKANWTRTNADLAREFGVSRERVRQVRAQLKIKKVKGRK
jgi:hypothetical protein